MGRIKKKKVMRPSGRKKEKIKEDRGERKKIGEVWRAGSRGQGAVQADRWAGLGAD